MEVREDRDEHIVLKILKNQSVQVIAIISIAFGVYFTFANPQQRIDSVLSGVQAELSKHEALQAESARVIAEKLNLISQGDIKDLKADLLENRTQIDSVRLEIVKLETIIQERFPIKK